MFRASPDVGISLASLIGDSNFVAYYQVALDSSGTLGQHAAIACAGVIATERQWAAFSEAWRQQLDAENLRYLKMAEVMTWHGEFRARYSEWGSERDGKRTQLLNRFADIAVQYQLLPVGFFADARLLTAGDLKTAKAKKRLFAQAVKALLRSAHTTGDSHVSLVCDSELDVEPLYRAWFNKYRAQAGSDVPTIVGICFMDDRFVPPLQLADVVAWLFRERGERLIATDDAELHWLLVKLGQGLTQFDLGKADLDAFLPDSD